MAIRHWPASSLVEPITGSEAMTASGAPPGGGEPISQGHPVSAGESTGPADHESTWAVIVTWFPGRERFEELARRLDQQVSHSVIVDNGSDVEVVGWLRQLVAQRVGRATLIELDSNEGIAAAQNTGIRLALARGASRILLMDHDSLPGPDMVTTLVAVLRKLVAEGNRVAAVGPRYLDPRQNNPPPFIRVRGGRLHRLPCPDAQTVQSVDYLIASGSLIPREALEHVGLMNDALFIDYVDIEWGLRAADRGYRSYGVCGALMQHDLGGEPIVVFGMAKPNHSVSRHYYLFRNAAWLYLHSPVPRGWKFVDGYRLVLRFGFYTLFARPRTAHIRAMLCGLRDGVRGRLGPAPR